MIASIAQPLNLPIVAGSRQLRISVVTETYPPEVNGVAMTIGRMVNGLLDRGHTVQLIRPRQHRNDHPRREQQLEILPLPGFRIPFYRELRMGFPAGRLLTEQWRHTPPDVVHLVTEGPLGSSALNAARRLGLRVVSDFHTNFHSYSRHYGAGILAQPLIDYLRRFHNRAHSTLVPTEELAEELRALGFVKLGVLARGVDTKLFSPDHRDPKLRQSWGAGPDDLVMLCVGRIAAEKNLQLALAAYEALRTIRPTARLVLVGDGPMASRLRARYPDVVFPGMRTGADLAAHYASADIFLFPSLTETFGNVTLEAMASGLAVVAFDYAAAHRHIVHGHSGLLAACDAPSSFIAAVRQLADDPALVPQLGLAARQAVAKFDWEQIHRQLEQWFLEPAIEERMP